jgi:hypothetical protein
VWWRRVGYRRTRCRSDCGVRGERWKAVSHTTGERCIPRLQARRISTPRSPAGYYALRDATPWDQDVFNTFDGKFRVRVIMPQCGSVLAPGRRLFPNVLPVNGSGRRHASGPRKRNATPLRFGWDDVPPPITSHLSRLRKRRIDTLLQRPRRPPE